MASKRDLKSGTKLPPGVGLPDMVEIHAYAKAIIDTLPDPDGRPGGRALLLPGLALACVHLCHATGPLEDVALHHQTMKALHKLIEGFHGQLLETGLQKMQQEGKAP